MITIWKMFQFCCLVLSLLLMGVFTITGCGSPAYVLNVDNIIPKIEGNTEIKKWEGDLDLGRVEEGEVEYLAFDKWVELRDGTRYVCKDSRGCRIDFAKGGVVTKGTIEVYEK